MASMIELTPHITPDDFGAGVALGHHRGWQGIRRFGMNAAVSGTMEVWPLGTIRTLPTTVVSSSTSDTSAGIGARKVYVNGLGENWEEIGETVTMNGTTPVTLTQQYRRINRMYVVTAGSNQTNVGNISGIIGANTQEYIAAGEGQSQDTAFAVPEGKVLLRTYFNMSTGALSADAMNFRTQIRNNGLGQTAWRTLTNIFVYQYQWENDFAYRIFPPRTDIRILVNTGGSNRRCAASYGGFLVDEAKWLPNPEIGLSI